MSQTNGDTASSQTLNHFTSYPFVKDGMSMYQSNSLGAKSIDIFHSLYSTFAAPVLPYLQTPYSVVSPYLAKVDSLGNASLESVDKHFPAVKDTDMEKLKGTAFSFVQFPFVVAGNGRDYVFKVYNDEYKKTGGQGILTTGQAVLSTEMRIIAESMHAAADFFGPKRDEAGKKFEQLKQNGINGFNDLKSSGAQKADQAKKVASDKADQAQKTGAQKTDEAKQIGNENIDQLKKTAQK